MFTYYVYNGKLFLCSKYSLLLKNFFLVGGLSYKRSLKSMLFYVHYYKTMFLLFSYALRIFKDLVADSHTPSECQ